MNLSDFNKAINLAFEHMLNSDGKTLRKPNLNIESDLIAYALLSNAGAGPFEEQKKRIEAWANERERTFERLIHFLDRGGLSDTNKTLESKVLDLIDENASLKQRTKWLESQNEMMVENIRRLEEARLRSSLNMNFYAPISED